MKKSVPFIKFFSSDWKAGCVGLSLVEEIIYFKICVHNWDTGTPLSQSRFDRMMRMQCEGNADAYADALQYLCDEEKVVKTDEGYFNERALKSNEEANERRDKAIQAAKGRWGKSDKRRKNKEKVNPANAYAGAYKCALHPHVKCTCQPEPEPEPEPELEERTPENHDPYRSWESEQIPKGQLGSEDAEKGNRLVAINQVCEVKYFGKDKAKAAKYVDGLLAKKVPVAKIINTAQEAFMTGLDKDWLIAELAPRKPKSTNPQYAEVFAIQDQMYKKRMAEFAREKQEAAAK